MRVHVFAGSKSDSAVIEKVEAALQELGIDHKTDICSAHRNLPELIEKVKNSDADVFIGIAGLSAALPGVIAGLTTKPVIGVPVSGKLNIDSILSMVQMPPGVPVAVVGLDNGKNAAVLAARILGIKDKEIEERLSPHG